MSVCRSCGARVWWALTDKNKRIPLDEPSPDGNLYVTRMDGGGLRATMFEPDLDPSKYHRTKSHFATCPQADEHRNPR